MVNILLCMRSGPVAVSRFPIFASSISFVGISVFIGCGKRFSRASFRVFLSLVSNSAGGFKKGARIASAMVPAISVRSRMMLLLI